MVGLICIFNHHGCSILLQGCHLFSKMRPVDQLRSLLEQVPDPECQAIEAFFRLYEVSEVTFSVLPNKSYLLLVCELKFGFISTRQYSQLKLFWDVFAKYSSTLNGENRRRNAISLNQPLGLSAKMAANGIRTHARTEQRQWDILWCGGCGNP